MKIRNIIFWLHLIVGITVGTVILIVAVTGMILAFRPQIIAWNEHDMYKIEAPDSPQTPLGIQVLLDEINKNVPEAHPTAITVSADPQAPVMIKQGENSTLYVNPYSGGIIGRGSSMRHWFDDVEYWHRWLGMGGGLKVFGGNIKRACNLAFFFIILSGLYIWWPPNWTPKVVQSRLIFNPTLEGGVRDWNWHNVIGFWCAPVLIIISLTGIIMSYPWANNLLYRMTGNTPPALSQNKEHAHHRHHDDDEGQPSQVSLDKLFARAEGQESGWKTITLRLYDNPHAPAVFNIEESGVGHRSQLTLNPQDGSVVKWEPYSSQNSGRKLRTYVRFLHTGEELGLIGQIIAFFAAGGLVLLIWTGFAKAYRRIILRRPV